MTGTKRASNQKCSMKRMLPYLEAVIESGEVDQLQPKQLYDKYKEFRTVPLKKFRDRLYRAKEMNEAKQSGMSVGFALSIILC